MTLAALLILAVGLGSDAFAAAVANGAAARHPRLRDAAATAAYFGVAEGVMVALGFLLGTSFSSMIESIDHWVAFVLLSVIGGKMIRDGLQGEEDPDPAHDDPAAIAPGVRRGPLQMVLTAIGTSIDSAVVGVTLALVGVSLTLAVPLIGLTSFAMSLAGVLLGRRLGPLFGRKAEVLGGIALILIGAHILFDHLSAG
jgi:putative Mn2+ efflux pump MntP